MVSAQGSSWNWQTSLENNDGNFIHSNDFLPKQIGRAFRVFSSTWDFVLCRWSDETHHLRETLCRSWRLRERDQGRLSKTQKKTNGVRSSLGWRILYPNDAINWAIFTKNCWHHLRGKWASKMAFILVLKGPGNEWWKAFGLRNSDTFRHDQWILLPFLLPFFEVLKSVCVFHIYLDLSTSSTSVHQDL